MANQHQTMPPHEDPDSDEARQRIAQQAVAAVRSGDVEAYARIVEIYKDRIMTLCVGLMRDAQSAEELAQDVFVRAYRYIDTYDARRPIYPWLATIAYRLAQTRWVQRKRQAVSHCDALDRLADGSAPPHTLQALIVDEDARRLWRAVHALPDGQRAAVLLYYNEGMDVRQVAQILGVSSGTVKTLLFRARRRLHEVLSRGQRDKANGAKG
jgi:RNA polymerase sigma-70 factor, ECF subfamily